jgi:hypothetical protein
MNTQPGLLVKRPHGEGDPGSESELTSESARVLHSEAGRLADCFPSFQLSGEQAPKETREREGLGLVGAEDVTGGSNPGYEFLPPRDGDLRVLVPRLSIWD